MMGYAVGSKDDFGTQIEALKLPPSWTFLGEYYHDPPAKRRRRRPSLVRWFSLDGSLEQGKSQIVSCFEGAGIRYRLVRVREIITGNDDTYFFFVTIDQPMIAKNPMAPSGTQVEVVAKTLRGIKEKPGTLRYRFIPW